MSSLERVLAPGSEDLPDCICGREMILVRREKADDQKNVETRTYHCTPCGRELRLMVWMDPVV